MHVVTPEPALECSIVVEENVAQALNALRWTRIDEFAVLTLIRTDLGHIARNVSELAESAEELSAESVRELAEQLTRCAAALEAVA